MSTTSNDSYYAVGQRADRLIQIELRADQRVRALVRKNVAGAWSTTSASVFKPAVDATQPIKFTVAVTPDSWGHVEASPAGWSSDPYPYEGVLYLNASQPFGSDIDWGGSVRNPPNAKFFSNVIYTFQNGIVTNGDQTDRKSFTTTVDLSKAFAAPGADAILFIVLRLAPGNSGGVRFENVQDAAQLNFDV